MSGLLEYKLDLIAEVLDAYSIREVHAVIRRQFENDDGSITDIIDFYPAWNEYGTFGKHTVGVEYLNHDWQRQRFEKHAGVTVDGLPIYGGEAPVMRRFGRTHQCEVLVRPFRLMLQPRKDEEGNNKKSLILRYLPASRLANQQPAEPSAAPVGAPTPPPARNGRVNGNGSRQSQAVAPPAESPAKADAAGPVEFDDLVSATEQGLAEAVLKVQPWFKSTDNISAFRKTLFGEWQPGETYIDAYFAGLLRYAELRKGQQSHQAAKIEALNRYHRELKETNHATNAG